MTPMGLNWSFNGSDSDSNKASMVGFFGGVVGFFCMFDQSFFFFWFETLRLCSVFVWCEDERKYEKVLGFVVVCELFGFLES